ncbi:4-hydroxy-3-methylbut-2-enyl diphosphate reductase [Kiloniella laminariae]|uniref:4-hydroxy-3-methylbut-2-enyl diphosphate reductase n=1 Tax=Kiloniella laminariae TaxID=454162 RepID=A0ABT4LL38_9PROT|nr:4-hydroxy-3-methylbut-2-enyl diphosphate reductase [Kiloniella laminariae]MCZ4281796.1 4-hydroxy-3-methylbut-2-enyl diphosphate reductase [Kiloniella laminariae]
MTKPALTILLASPRGFCAGVDRAIEIVERALVKHGAPVYVRHEIVHNRFVVESLEQKGAIFVQELDEVPEGVPVIFSAHGVPKSVPEAAKARNLLYFDATCPLVSKVHREAERHEKDGRQVILIGHAGHPEVIGTMGQLSDNSIVLVETEQDAEELVVPDSENLAYVTQTTLSVDDTASIIKILLRRFPNMMGPKQEDICYATTNRQEAVKAISARCDALLVIGAPNSSNSKRLVEVAFKQGCEKAALVQRATDIQWDRLAGIKTLGITAGASAPEVLVEEVIDAFRAHFDVRIEEVNIRDEDVVFKVPKTLSDTTANKEIH